MSTGLEMFTFFPLWIHIHTRTNQQTHHVVIGFLKWCKFTYLTSHNTAIKMMLIGNLSMIFRLKVLFPVKGMNEESCFAYNVVSGQTLFPLFHIEEQKARAGSFREQSCNGGTCELARPVESLASIRPLLRHKVSISLSGRKFL